MRIVGSLLLTFAAGIVGFFVLIGAAVMTLVCWAAGIVSALYLVAALWQTARWWVAGDTAAGRAALGCWAIAAVAFAVTPVIVRGAGLARTAMEERRGRAVIARTRHLRLALR